MIALKSLLFKKYKYRSSEILLFNIWQAYNTLTVFDLTKNVFSSKII